MNWNRARLLIYLAGLIASGLAIAGLADFDPATGNFDIHAFNAYAAAGAVSGVVTSALAGLALIRGWGSKK